MNQWDGRCRRAPERVDSAVEPQQPSTEAPAGEVRCNHQPADVPQRALLSGAHRADQSAGGAHAPRRPVVEPRSYVLEGFVEGWNIERVVGDRLIDPTAPLQHQQLGRVDRGCRADDCALDGENTQRPARHGGDHHPSSPSMLAEPSPDVTPFPGTVHHPAHRCLFIQRKEPGGDSPRDVRQIRR